MRTLARKSDRALFETLQSLTTESRNPRTMGIDLADTREILGILHAEDRLVADRVQEAIPQLAEIADQAACAFSEGGSLYYAGAGTSGRLGVLDAAECPPTFGSSPEQVVGLIAGGFDTLVRSREGVEDLESEGVRAVDEHELGERDLLVGISASRRTPYVHGALRRARERGAWTAFLVCNELAPEQQDCADCVVEVVVGPEAITGSTRMKSALAQKMMLTMISTTAMVRVGKVYENLMVDVAPTSQKLVERAKGLVMRLSDVDYEAAGTLLEASDYQVKPAVVMARRGIDFAAAQELLAASGGLLRRVLEDPEESRA